MVCCKNEATVLPRLLSSIAVQIDDIDEIVFASDHSTDSTFEAKWMEFGPGLWGIVSEGGFSTMGIEQSIHHILLYDGKEIHMSMFRLRSIVSKEETIQQIIQTISSTKTAFTHYSS